MLPHTAQDQIQAGLAYNVKPEPLRVADFKLQSGALLTDMVVVRAQTPTTLVRGKTCAATRPTLRSDGPLCPELPPS